MEGNRQRLPLARLKDPSQLRMAAPRGDNLETNGPKRPQDFAPR